MFTLIFHPDADEEIQELDDRMRGKAILALELLSAQGNQLRYPHTEPLRNGLIELRAGSKDITRTIFAFAKVKKSTFSERLLRKHLRPLRQR